MILSTPDHLAITDHLLMTTRSVRKRLDLNRPVEPEVVFRCIEIAMQAPTGSNQQGWHFMVITNTEKRAEISRLYRDSWYAYANARKAPANEAPTDGPSTAQMERVISSAQYLADKMQDVPILILACYNGRPTEPSPSAQAGLYGSILPAVWSLMLALRARGLGSAWTTLHLRYEQEIAQLLDIPDDAIQLMAQKECLRRQFA